MNYFAFLSLFNSIACLSIGIYAFSKNSKAKLNRVFFLLCICFAWYTFSEFQFLSAETEENAKFWTLITFEWFMSSVIFHFTRIFARPKSQFSNNKWTLFGIYAPAFVFSFCKFVPNLTWVEVYSVWWGWVIVYSNGIINILSLLWAFLMVVFCLPSLMHIIKKKVDSNIKKQAKLIFYTVFSQIILGFITVFLLPVFGIEIPDLTGMWSLAICFFIGYAMVKFGLFALSPTAAMQKTLSTMSEAFLLVDINGTILQANAAATNLLGFRSEEILNQTVTQLFAGCSLEDFDSKKEGIDRIIGSDVINNLEVNIKSRKGNYLPLAISKSNVFDEKGRTSGFIYLLSDLTALKESEAARVAERQRVTQEFVAKFSHELRNPLNAIIGFAELLIDQKLEPLTQSQVEFLRDIHDSGIYLLSLIMEVLDLTKLESGKMAFPMEWFSLKDLLELVMSQVGQMCQKKGIDIIYHELNEEIRIYSCKLKLQQVLLNLLGNAIKFTPSGGGPITLSIQAKKEGGIVFSVEDNGIGIRDEDKGLIFQKFTHLDKSMEGTGLGLVISKQIISRLGGDLQFESTFGKGSKFFFTLPFTLPESTMI